uniref:Bet n=1 Tax=Simian foamy virus TaxID=11642 RepID=A0A6J3YL31_9RETR|nr:Bet [Simian foamy virus]
MASWEKKKELTHLHAPEDNPLADLSILLDMDEMDPNDSKDDNPGASKLAEQLEARPGTSNEKTYQFGYKDKEDQRPDLKLRDWVPDPEHMTQLNLSNPESGLILSEDIGKSFSSLRLGPGAPDANKPVSQGPILPVVTPWPLCQDHAAPTLYSILDAYTRGYQNQQLQIPPWLWQCQEDHFGNKCTMTQFLVPPLGQVTVKLYNSHTVIIVGQSVDPWENDNQSGGVQQPCCKYEPRIPCDRGLCFKVIYEGNIWNKVDQPC